MILRWRRFGKVDDNNNNANNDNDDCWFHANEELEMLIHEILKSSYTLVSTKSASSSVCRMDEKQEEKENNFYLHIYLDSANT